VTGGYLCSIVVNRSSEELFIYDAPPTGKKIAMSALTAKVGKFLPAADEWFRLLRATQRRRPSLSFSSCAASQSQSSLAVGCRWLL